MKKYQVFKRSAALRSLVNERPVAYREASKTKLNPVPEKKRSLDTTQKCSEAKPLKKNKTEQKVQENKELHVKNEVPEEENESQLELNELMTRLVEEELQTVMIEVWQALPDEPPTETERYVAEKLRNEVSDDLRNVLGLNVTKRLLNVYNPLYVKLRFSCRPESGWLTKFLDTYNIRSFKRINKETNTFAARLNSITDFDNICAVKEIRCGGAKITISPCYKYTECPKNLNTMYADKNKEDINSEKDTNKIDVKKNPNTSKEKEKITELNTKEEKRTDVHQEMQQLNKVDASEMKETKTIQSNIVTEKVKCNENIKQQDAESNTSENKTITKINTSLNKSKTEEPKEVNKIKTPITKPVQKAVSKESSIDKILSKTNKTSEIKQKVILNELEIIDSEIDNEFDDGDEMNDEEILALISSGVIVDECIGSDEE